MKTSTPPVLITFALVCFAFLQNTHAVSPPPDGDYPGGNTAEGQNALLSLTSGTYNTAVGLFSLRTLTEGKFNTAVGAGALLSNNGDPTTGAGSQNTATGAGALLGNSIGGGNTANGAFALFSNTEGGVNTATGAFALFNNTTGFQDTANATNALLNNTTGSGNTALGSGAASDVTRANNVICIGASGADVDNSCFISNIFGVTTNFTAIPVLVDSTGQLGTISSSGRFKKEIKPMDSASEAVLALKPVTFHYKSDKREEWPDLHRALRRGQRDVAQRVPQRASQSGGARKTGGKAHYGPTEGERTA